MNGSIRVKVPAMDQESIKDTIGAGDSFIAGFLHSVAHVQGGQSCSLRNAINNGVE